MPGNSISYPMVKDDEKVKKVPKVKDEEKVKKVPKVKDEEKVKSVDVPRKRLEDVFQDDIIKAFVKLSEFKKFARSRDGLGLSEYDIETICEDYNSLEERKMKMLNKWKQKQGRNATVERILQIKENYIIKLNEED